MKHPRCNFCGSTVYETRKTDYFYIHKGNCLHVPDTPVKICCRCGIFRDEPESLQWVEEQFAAIQKNTRPLDGYAEMPQPAFANALST